MSRERLSSDRGGAPRRRRVDSGAGGEEEGDESLTSPRARKESSRALERLDRAERIEAERQEQLRLDEAAKEQRRRARAERKASVGSGAEAHASSTTTAAPTLDDDEEEAARQARRAARRAARLAAEQQQQQQQSQPSDSPTAESGVSRSAARQADLVRDVFDRDETVPRFRRPVPVIAEEEKVESVRSPEDEPKPRRKKREESEEVAAAIVSPRRKSTATATSETPASRTDRASSDRPVVSPRPRKMIREEEEVAEVRDQVEPLPSPAMSPAASRGSSARSESFSGALPEDVPLPVTAATSADRARMAAIAAAQKSLDVAGLNRALKHVPAVFFQKENFNPFNHWNDAKSELDEWKEYVDVAVEKVVEAYHKGFNAATSSFTHVIDKFSESQKLVRRLQENLAESKRLLQSRNQNLKEYYFQNRMSSKMKEILEKVAYVVEIPTWIDRYLARRQYVHVVVLVQHTLSLLVSEDLVGIEGLVDLREEILLRKHFVQQLLVEELHRIVYMKERDANDKQQHQFQAKSPREQGTTSPAAENVIAFNPDGTRVKVVAPLIDTNANRSPTLASQSAPRPTPADSKYSPFYAAVSTFTLVDDESSVVSDPLSPSIQSLLKEEMQDAYLRDPEANPTKLLGLLVESLAHMHHLPSVKTQVNKRMRGELLAIIQRETSLAKDRAKFSMPRRVLARATESGYLTQGSELLVDLIERIFHVLAQVLKNHLELIVLIQSRLNSGGGAAANRPDTKFSIDGVWQVIQIVLQMTLTDYLHSSQTIRRGGSSDVRSVASRPTRGKKAPVDLLSELTFSFEDSSAPSVVKLSRNDQVQSARNYRAKAAVATTTSNQPIDLSVDLAQAQYWIEATPYNITAVYRSVVHFTDQAHSLIRQNADRLGVVVSPSPSTTAGGDLDDDALMSDANQLRNFLKIFIEVSFLPRVEADVNIRLDEVLNDPAAFDARELQRDARYSYHAQAAASTSLAGIGPSSTGTAASTHTSSVTPPLRAFPCAELEHNLLFKCVLDISDVLKKNFQDMFMLPHSLHHFLAIIDHTASRLIDKCHDKFHDELVKTSRGVERGYTQTPQQLLLTADDKFLSLLEDDPLLKVLRVGSEAATAIVDDDESDELSQYFSHINPIYAPLFHKSAQFDRSQLQFDTRIWSQLSLMAESIEWMADRLFHMNVFSPELTRIWQEGTEGGPAGNRAGHARNMPRRPGGRFSSRHGPRLDSFRAHQYHELKRHGEDGFARFLASKPLLDQKRWYLAGRCLALADRCLFTLRLELHSHIFFFIKEMQSSAYWCANDATEPESFVTELNRDLTLIDDAISKYLATDKKKYVFGGCYELLTNLLVWSLRHLQDKRVNSKGVSKICRNLFALQQNLNNIDGAATHANAQTSIAQTAHANNMAQATQTQRQEALFDRARQYYELLNYSTEDLHLFQLENPDTFSAEEYSAIMAIQTQTRSNDHRFN